MTRVDRVVTSGVFTLDGGEWEVKNNVWVVGDDEEVLIIDAAHDPDPIVEAVAGRAVTAIALTHGHNDHINAAPALAEAVGAPIYLHPDDVMLWQQLFPAQQPDRWLSDGVRLPAGQAELIVLHTPGHSPGGCCLYDPAAGRVFTGDTLFQGGPGATGRSFSDFPTIIASIADRLLVLPRDTVVLTGHGESTTIGEEAPHLEEWLARGH